MLFSFLLFYLNLLYFLKSYSSDDKSYWLIQEATLFMCRIDWFNMTEINIG